LSSTIILSRGESGSCFGGWIISQNTQIGLSSFNRNPFRPPLFRYLMHLSPACMHIPIMLMLAIKNALPTPR
jgi:hypothetical protein